MVPPRPSTPALAITTSMRPNRSSVKRTDFWTDARSVTSHCSARQWPLGRVSATDCAVHKSISAITTRAPRRVSALAVAAPSPRPAPVMKATLPDSEYHFTSKTTLARE